MGNKRKLVDTWTNKQKEQLKLMIENFNWFRKNRRRDSGGKKNGK